MPATRFAVVAGETSGDILGAALIRALRSRFPEASFYGVAGPRMIEAGCYAIESIEALSVMGLAEVLRDLPRLLRLRRSLVRRFGGDRPDCYIGVDAPDFNLGIERKLRRRGIRAVHFGSPSVWAWRQGRVNGIRKSVDLMLTLLPFEARFYEAHGVPVAYVGHPLADELDDATAPAPARAALGLPAEGTHLAILPGSRAAEIKYLAQPFAETAAWLHQRLPELRCIVPVAGPDLRPALAAAFREHAPCCPVTLLDGRSREAMQAADAVLLASGTAALECLLLGRPMVVGYCLSRLTASLLRTFGLLKISHVSLPNILCSHLCPTPVVPEFLQEDARADRFGPALLELLQDPGQRAGQLEAFSAARGELRRGAASLAAEAIAGLLEA